jgi:hypothetical protein
VYDLESCSACSLATLTAHTLPGSGDYALGNIRYLPLNSAGQRTGADPIVFDGMADKIWNIEQAPDGSLWYSSMHGIDRIFYVNPNGNQHPVITSVRLRERERERESVCVCVCVRVLAELTLSLPRSFR